MDVKDGVGWVALQEDLVVLRVVGQRPSLAVSGQKRFRIELFVFPLHMRKPRPSP
jgi:hypothetical protein